MSTKSKIAKVLFNPEDRSLRDEKKPDVKLCPLATVFNVECKKCQVWVHGRSLSLQEVFSLCLPNQKSLETYKIYSDLRRRGYRLGPFEDFKKLNQVTGDEVESKPSDAKKSKRINKRKEDEDEEEESWRSFCVSQEFLELKDLPDQDVTKILYKLKDIQSWSELDEAKNFVYEDQFRGLAHWFSGEIRYCGCVDFESIIKLPGTRSNEDLYKQLQENAPKVAHSNCPKDYIKFHQLSDTSGNKAKLVINPNSEESVEKLLFDISEPVIVANVQESVPSYFKVTPFEIWDEIE